MRAIWDEAQNILWWTCVIYLVVTVMYAVLGWHLS